MAQLCFREIPLTAVSRLGWRGEPLVIALEATAKFQKQENEGLA